MKKRILTCLIILVMLLIVVEAGEILGDLYYWYSDKSSIGFFYDSPSIFLDYDSNYPSVGTAAQYASQQWNNADISNYFTSTSSGAKIGMFCYDYSTLHAIEPLITSSTSGLTDVTATYVGDFTYNSSTKFGYSHIGAYVFVVTDVSSNYQKTCTHELGHALGWNGHSSNSSDVMYYATTSITSLTTRDIDHLKQVY